MSIDWMIPMRGNIGHTASARDGVVGTMCKKGAGASQMSLSIRMDVMEAMRWVVGDRILVGYDNAQNTIVIRRDARGHKLCQPGQKGNLNIGKCLPAIVKITMRGTIPESIFPFYVPLSDCVADGVDLHLQPKSAGT